MTTWGAPLNEDNQSIKTAQSYGDRGDGVSDWFGFIKNPSLGAPSDTAVEGGTVTGSIVSLLKGVQKALGIPTDAATPTGNGSNISLLRAIRDQLRIGLSSDATWVNASSGNQANATASADITATSGKTNYIVGAEITFAGATAGSNAIATITGLAGGTISYICSVPAGPVLPGSPLILKFDPPLPASAANTLIRVSLPALGSGNTHACVNIHGFKI